jgi:hypothetical protein
MSNVKMSDSICLEVATLWQYYSPAACNSRACNTNDIVCCALDCLILEPAESQQDFNFSKSSNMIDWPVVLMTA